MSKIKNYARFYALLNTIHTGDKQEFKEDLVNQFTSGRTSSLREMRQGEYDAMCNSIDTNMTDRLKAKMEIKAQRSAVLKRMQRMGIDTTDWNKIDTFCLNSRIAGKKFYELTVEELKAMIPKLIAISKKTKATKETTAETTAINSAIPSANDMLAAGYIQVMMNNKTDKNLLN